eukprot:3696437-Rhodomonas_salina.1
MSCHSPGAHSSNSRQVVPGGVPGVAAQPGSQAQVKEPMVSEQTACTLQSCPVWLQPGAFSHGGA